MIIPIYIRYIAEAIYAHVRYNCPFPVVNGKEMIPSKASTFQYLLTHSVDIDGEVKFENDHLYSHLYNLLYKDLGKNLIMYSESFNRLRWVYKFYSEDYIHNWNFYLSLNLDLKGKTMIGK
jgi:hypothetical protein